MSDIYLSLTETPAVVTLSQPVVSGALSSTVTVANTVTVALDANSLAALESVTVTVGNVTIGSSVSVSNFPATQVVSVSNLPAAQVVTGTVALDSASLAALESVTVTVGNVTIGSSVSISNFPAQQVVSVSNLPASQTVAGTVTANIGNVAGEVDGPNPSQGVQLGYKDAQNEFKLVGDDQGLPISLFSVGSTIVTSAGVPISGTVTVSSLPALAAGTAQIGSVTASISGTVPVSISSVTIGNFPATQTIAGTVTANISNSVTITTQKFENKIISLSDGSSSWSPLQFGVYELFYNSAVTATLNNIFGSNPAWVEGYSDSIAVYNDDGTSESYFSDGTQWVLSDFLTPAGNTVITGSEIVTSLTNDSSASLLNGFKIIQKNTPIVKDNRLYVSSTGTSTVTVGAMPNGSLTTRFGTPTTASVAFATSAVTNASRKYLLIQNVTTGSNVITVGIGFTPTTTQGIQLVAGAGITFESSYIPTGAVYVLSSVTASNFTVLEA